MNDTAKEMKMYSFEMSPRFHAKIPKAAFFTRSAKSRQKGPTAVGTSHAHASGGTWVEKEGEGGGGEDALPS